eukprot:COSAG02_NODE_42784_length_381_cov_0.911348_1_plen_58_part_10
MPCCTIPRSCGWLSSSPGQFYSINPVVSLSIGQRHQHPQNIGVSNAPTTLLTPHFILS